MEIAKLEIIIAGAIFMGSIILGLGPQNLHVIRCGLENNHVKKVVLICIIGDIAIMSLGVYCLAYILIMAPRLEAYLRYSGFLILGYYSITSLLQVKKRDYQAELIQGFAPVKGAMLFTFGNPCVYLDSFFLIGQQASLYKPEARIFYTLGAALASTAWYLSLGFGSLILKDTFEKTRFRVLLNLLSFIVLGFASLGLIL